MSVHKTLLTFGSMGLEIIAFTENIIINSYSVLFFYYFYYSFIVYKYILAFWMVIFTNHLYIYIVFSFRTTCYFSCKRRKGNSTSRCGSNPLAKDVSLPN